jgi:hypothetical protein
VSRSYSVRRPPNRPHTSQRPAGDREKPSGRAVSSPFSDLPPPNHARVGEIIRNNLKDVISALSAFSQSVQHGRKPEWPSNATLALFTAQLEAFRSISTRREDAKPIQLIREIDHRWIKLGLLETLIRAVCALETYSGKSLLGKAHAEEQFELGIATGSILKHPLLTLVLRHRKATAVDLPLMLPLVPSCFTELENALKDITPSEGYVVVASLPLTQALNALALSVQAYLGSEHGRFMCHQTMAFPLRKCLFELKHPSFRKRLFGFSAEEIQAWDEFEDSRRIEKQQEQNRARSKRFRKKQQTKRAE